MDDGPKLQTLDCTLDCQAAGVLRHWAEWLKSSKEETAFEMVYGTGLWSVCSHAPELGELFNNAMAADSAFIMDVAIRGAGQVFGKITSLVDVAGGTGMAARVVATAFPHVKCTVLDLPHVIDPVPADCGSAVQFVSGDMMDFSSHKQMLFCLSLSYTIGVTRIV
ncbi:hypothetical protein E2562_036724 [Oryza meyeriana var. granulata]|uniref:O-methyltransferase C-terminal domain-containing protein n=1 Tax=Oryza meyeriana var. granulata TaxID=110450 RepID=A0A6G1E7H4_9ORYZ|nr:hypothetical protein E2562_036724 [Oryza meyeriana var. granulata]